MVTCMPASLFCCWSTSIQTTPWSQVWQQTASPHCSSPMVSPPWGLSSPEVQPKLHGSSSLPQDCATEEEPWPAFLPRWPWQTPILPATLAAAAEHGHWSSAALPCLAWAFQYSSSHSRLMDLQRGRVFHPSHIWRCALQWLSRT